MGSGGGGGQGKEPRSKGGGVQDCQGTSMNRKKIGDISSEPSPPLSPIMVLQRPTSSFGYLHLSSFSTKML